MEYVQCSEQPCQYWRGQGDAPAGIIVPKLGYDLNIIHSRALVNDG